jgi:translation initiation factor 2 subunit 2
MAEEVSYSPHPTLPLHLPLIADCSHDMPQPSQERKARKSVAFTEQKVVFDADGNATMMASDVDDGKDSAQSHAPSTPPLSAALNQFTDAAQAGADLGDPAAASVPELPTGGDDDAGLDLKLLKKKKKKVKAEPEEGEAEDNGAADGEDGAGEEAGLDVSSKATHLQRLLADSYCS